MKARPVKLYMTRGEDKTFELAVTTDDGVAQVLTGVTFYWQAKYRREDVTTVLTKSSTSGIAITDAALGLASLTLAYGDTAGLAAPLTLYWELEVVDTTTQRRKYPSAPQYGLLVIAPNVVARP